MADEHRARPTSRGASVLTVSDGVAAGRRSDESGEAVVDRLEADGFAVVARRVVPDEVPEIAEAIRDLAGRSVLVVTTGGTGLGPRDRTPEATAAAVDRLVPGLAEAMRAAGRRTTPLADLSRQIAGALGTSLVLNLPGSTRGALESLDAVLPVLPHALDLLAGHTVHHDHDHDHDHDHEGHESHGGRHHGHGGHGEHEGTPQGRRAGRDHH